VVTLSDNSTVPAPAAAAAAATAGTSPDDPFPLLLGGRARASDRATSSMVFKCNAQQQEDAAPPEERT
jgi:hypothetical protein